MTGTDLAAPIRTSNSGPSGPLLSRAADHRLAHGSIDRRRLVAAALPLVLPAAMSAVFTIGRRRFGDQLGYLTGFGIYWALSGALSVGLIGPAGLRELARDRRPRLGRSAPLGAFLLAWPAAGAIATRFAPELRDATPAELATSVAVAVVNATVEETLWRGVYVSLWPENAWLGWLWPAIGFGAWHAAPQVVHPSAIGTPRYVTAATALGLSWGWVAYRTGSIHWTCLSHVLTDGSGLRNARYFIRA